MNTPSAFLRSLVVSVALVVALIAVVPAPSEAQAPTTVDLAVVTPDVVAFGADTDERFSGPFGGDFNGDGWGDLLFTAHWADGPGNARPEAGEAYVVFGPFSPPEALDMALGHHDIIIYGADPVDLLGTNLAVGDVNGDDIDDILLISQNADGPGELRDGAGEAYVILGSPALPPTIDIASDEQDLTIYGADPSDHLGSNSSAKVADVNGDQFDDIVIGSPACGGPGNGRPNAGELHVIFGSSAPSGTVDLALGEHDFTVYGDEPGDGLGYSVAVGDVNDDGVGDILTAASHADGPGDTRTNAGDVYAVFGPVTPGGTVDTALDEQDFTVYGPQASEMFGMHMLFQGDLNGDTVSDVYIMNPWGDGPGEERPEAGEAYVVFGSAGLSGAVDVALGEQDIIVYGAEAGDYIYSSPVHDLNGDGLDDLAVSAIGGDGPGNARPDAGEGYVVFGPLSPGTIDLASDPVDLELIGQDSDENWHTRLLPDLDGDGAGELAATTWYADGPGDTRPDAGEAQVFFSGDTDADGTMDAADDDDDDDGCSDEEEAGLGSVFQSKAWYDVYDVPVPAYPDPRPNGARNRVVGIGDVLAVLFYAFADEGGSANANGVDYDSDKGVDADGDTVADVPPDGVADGLGYDRSPGSEPDPVTGIDPAGEPNGVIDIADVLAVLAQALVVDCTGP